MKLTKEVREYMSSLGKKGGKARTKRKVQTAKANGKLGGRPKGSTKTKAS